MSKEDVTARPVVDGRPGLAYRGWKAARQQLSVLVVLLVALAVRALLLYADVVPFNSDEAVVALMARHILQGERPIFFYGQAYLGSLDAWLIAGVFAALGQSVLVIRWVQLALFLGALYTTYLLGRRVFASRWVGLTAALFLAVPTVLVAVYTTATLGGYGEVLLMGNLLLLMALRLVDGHDNWIEWLAFGLLSGLGFWTFPLIGVYLLPSIAYLSWAHRGRPRALLGAAGLAGLGFVMGCAPWWWYTFTHGLVTISEMGGAAIAGASSASPVAAVAQHLLYFLLFGLTVISGLRPPWGLGFLVWPGDPVGLGLHIFFVPIALILNLALLVFMIRRALRPRNPARLLLGCCATLVAGFVLSPFGADPSGRYFLPLAPPFALFMAEMLRPRGSQAWRARALALGLIAFNGWGLVRNAVITPPGLTTQFDPVAQVDQRRLPELVAFLRAQGETRGYTNYWVEYPLAFLSGEDLIFVARLPYHEDFRYTSRDNRYLPYSQTVDASPRVAYITTRHSLLDARIRAGLSRLGVDFQEAQLGDFHVFYDLSRKVTPEELGLGVDQP